jgi:hypothetical protein
MASFEFNVQKYSVQELKSLFFQAGKNINVNLYESYQESSIIKCRNKLQQILISEHPNEKMDVLNFLEKASQLLIQETILNTNDQQAFITLQPYPEKNTGFSNDGVFLKPVQQDNLNQNLKHTTSQIINLDSQYRENILPYDLSNADVVSSSTDYLVNFSQTLKNVLSLKLYSIQIPYTWYTFDENLGNNFFLYNENRIEITSGNYTNQELVDTLNKDASNNSYDISYALNVNNGKISIYTESDASFVFYDSNDTEFTQAKTKYSTPSKINYNLGWSMGFRPDYSNTKSTDIYYNVTSGSTLTAESIVDTYGTKYIYVIIDDYNQNHMNKGLVSIGVNKPFISNTNYKTDLSINCITDNDCNSRQSNTGLTSAQYGSSRTKANGFNKLTKTQTYTHNEIANYRKTFGDEKNSRNYAATTSNVFAVIPLDKNALETGSIITENGGPLQLNSRNYFGPVDVEKMRIRLVDDKGENIHLHGGDWVLNVVAECLYKY